MESKLQRFDVTDFESSARHCILASAPPQAMGLKLLLVALAALSGATAFAPSTSALPSARRSVVRASLGEFPRRARIGMLMLMRGPSDLLPPYRLQAQCARPRHPAPMGHSTPHHPTARVATPRRPQTPPTPDATHPALRPPNTPRLAAMRDSYMAGNWKLNPESLDDAKALAKEVVEASSDMPVRQAPRGRGGARF